MSITDPPLPTAARDLLRARLPLSARMPSLRSKTSIAWSGALPALFRPLAVAVRDTWGLRITRNRRAFDPLTLPAFAALFGQARADQVIRAFSARTNLVLAGSTTAVVGAGPLADALEAELTRIGVRVMRITADPMARVRSQLAGRQTAHLDELASAAADAHYVFVTGELHRPIDPRSVDAVVVDASLSGDGLKAVDGDEVRAHIRRAGSARIVDVPAPFPPHPDSEKDLSWHLADLTVALSLLMIEVAGNPIASDLLLAEEVLS